MTQANKARWLVRILTFLSQLPLPVVHGLGWLLGQMVMLFMAKDRRVTQVNLALAFPQLSAWQRWLLMRRFYIELGKTACELGWMWVAPPNRLLAKVKSVQGIELMGEALAKEKGVIVLTPHFGAWELAGAYWASTRKMTSLYQPPEYPEVETFITQARQRTGAKLVPTDISGVRALLSALKKNQFAGILPDQDPGDNGGDYVDFFGTPAYTMLLVGRLAHKSQASVVFTWCERLSWGRGYVIHVLPVNPAIAQADLQASASVMNADIARYVARKPEQYMWNYKRWKRQADGRKLYV